MNEVVTYSYDSETGLYYLQSRYYDPNTGRFLSADDTDELDNSKDSVLSPNLYAYCDNNPVVRTDADGHFWFLAALAAAVPEIVVIALVITTAVLIVAAAETAVSYLSYRYRNSVYFRKARNKPKEQGTPNSSELHKGRDGKLDGYTTYGPNGKMKKQVRLRGKPHGDQERPNVKKPRYNTDSKTGKKYQNGWRVRGARRWELPKEYK